MCTYDVIDCVLVFIQSSVCVRYLSQCVFSVRVCMHKRMGVTPVSMIPGEPEENIFFSFDESVFAILPTFMKAEKASVTLKALK